MKNTTVSALALTAGLFGGSAAMAEITVGMMLPTSGTYAALGQEIDAGFMLALEEAGQQDAVRIVREDTEARPQVGVQKARKLVMQDEADVLVGLVSSGVLGAIRDFVDGSQVPLIVANAGNDEATGDQCSRYITRVSFSNAQVSRPMGEYLPTAGITKVYTLAPDYAAGRQMIDAFTAEFAEHGGEVVGGEYTPFAQTEDFGPYLTNARASGAEALFVFYAGGEAISFVNQYGSFGISDSLPLYGTGFLNSQLYLDAEGDSAIGTVGSLHYVPSLDTPENEAFVAAYQERHNKLPSEYAVQGYDAGRVLIEAMATGADDRESLAEAIPQVSYTGPRGPLEIDPATHNVIQNVYIYEIVKEDDRLTQNILATIENVQDEPHGCTLGG
ncbi:MAG: ABC transporter substrate-binding protein [Paracoccus sp. (in: a-proteobacteria)]|nr:ABC transporter substrate-binding protein [Paracoccus sp. (in: a-proteobacteria)]